MQRHTEKIISTLSLAGLLLSPLITYAVTFKDFVNRVSDVFRQVAPVLFGFAVIAVAFGIFRYIGAGGDAKRMAEGRAVILWGIIGLFVMFSFWGFINFVLSAFFDQSQLSGEGFDTSGLFNN